MSNPWFSDITPPERLSLVDSVGYLDRLIGDSKTQRLFYTQTSNKYINKNDHNNQNKPATKSNSSTSRSQDIHKLSKPVGFDMDDALWIKERKQRYPRVSLNLLGQGVHVNDIKGPANTKEPSKDRDLNVSNGGLKNNNSRNSGGPNSRKKSLFEMLMDSEQ